MIGDLDLLLLLVDEEVWKGKLWVIMPCFSSALLILLAFTPTAPLLDTPTDLIIEAMPAGCHLLAQIPSSMEIEIVVACLQCLHLPVLEPSEIGLLSSKIEEQEQEEPDRPKLSDLPDKHLQIWKSKRDLSNRFLFEMVMIELLLPLLGLHPMRLVLLVVRAVVNRTLRVE